MKPAKVSVNPERLTEVTENLADARGTPRPVQNDAPYIQVYGVPPTYGTGRSSDCKSN